VIKQVHDALRPILDRFGEPSAFVVVIPWLLGNADFPFGTIVTREGQPLTASETLDSIDQGRKSLAYLANSFGLYVAAGREKLATLEREIHERAASGQEGQEDQDPRSATDGHDRSGPR
jgi:hypothetical protein